MEYGTDIQSEFYAFQSDPSGSIEALATAFQEGGQEFVTDLTALTEELISQLEALAEAFAEDPEGTAE